RGVRWFADAGLAAPQLYVPPAWALGALRSESLPAPPFRWIETLTGIHDLRARRFHVLPLAGFEADNGFRGVALRASNGASAAFARISGRPLRVAVHPHDLDLRLAGDLRRLLRTRIRSIGPDAI
ncbi:MAG TPA: DUF2334 domain-containing protein, partial [Dehalococcoidia bacterium]|nr:DUF2334 domain-containing protein [Dehalococcoidia bacterium]